MGKYDPPFASKVNSGFTGSAGTRGSRLLGHPHEYEGETCEWQGFEAALFEPSSFDGSLDLSKREGF